MSAPEHSPTVVEVLRFEELPLGSRGSRRAVVRWSDGTEGEALSWFADYADVRIKSACADSRVMPRGSRDRLPSAGAELDRSA